MSGPIGRTVADVALFLSAIAGPGRDPMSITEDPAKFRAPLGRSFKGVRVAWWTGLGGIPFEAEVRSVVNGTRKVFEDLGCAVEDAEPDFSGLDEAFPRLRFVNNHARYSALIARNPDWAVAFDMDAEAARLSRRKVFDMVVADKAMVGGYHFPFPAMGEMQAMGKGYDFKPLQA